MKGAKGVLINITGGLDMTLFEVDEAANRIRDEVDSEANIIFGSTFDESMEGTMRVSVVATGIDAEIGTRKQPVFTANNNVYGRQEQGTVKQPTVTEPTKVTATAAATEPKQTYATRESGSSLSASAPSLGLGGADTSTGGFNRGDMGSIPAGVLPQNTTPTYRPTAQSKAQQPTAGVSQASETSSQGAGYQYGTATPTQPTAPVQTATAKKQDAKVDVTATHTKPMNLGATQPRGQRYGNSFIPPKPFTAEDEDLFSKADATVTAEEKSALQGPTAPTVEKPVVEEKPGFFERLTGHRRHDIPTAPKKDEDVTLNVTKGGKKEEEDELDIPAFLRRQAN